MQPTLNWEGGEGDVPSKKKESENPRRRNWTLKGGKCPLVTSRKKRVSVRVLDVPFPLLLPSAMSGKEEKKGGGGEAVLQESISGEKEKNAVAVGGGVQSSTFLKGEEGASGRRNGP